MVSDLPAHSQDAVTMGKNDSAALTIPITRVCTYSYLVPVPPLHPIGPPKSPLDNPGSCACNMDRRQVDSDDGQAAAGSSGTSPPVVQNTKEAIKAMRVATAADAKRAADSAARSEEAAATDRAEAAADRAEAAADRRRMLDVLTRMADDIREVVSSGARPSGDSDQGDEARPDDPPNNLDTVSDLGDDVFSDVGSVMGNPFSRPEEVYRPPTRSSPDEDARRDHAKAFRARQLREWESAPRRAHWFVVGAMPTDHARSVLQSNFGEGTLVSQSVHAMLATLSNFSVKDFAKRGGAPGRLPVEFRVTIMIKAIISILRRSLPVDFDAERRACEQRLRPLFVDLSAFVRTVNTAAADYPRAFAEPATIFELEVLIDRDMLAWTDSVSNAAAEAARSRGGMPPSSVRDLPPLPSFRAANLANFVASNQLLRYNSQLAIGQTSSPGRDRAKSSQPCRKYQEGTCTRTAAQCRYAHVKPRGKRASTGGGGAGGAGAASPSQGKRRRSSDSAGGGSAAGDGTATATDKTDNDE